MPADGLNPALAEHRAIYAEHKAKADDLRLMIDNGLLAGMDEIKHRRLTAEYHDELLMAAGLMGWLLVAEGVWKKGMKGL